VRQLLVFARKGGGEPAVYALDETLAAIRPLLARLVGADVELRFELGAPEARVRFGAGEIEQILLNLVSNARQAMPSGGVVTARTEATTLGADAASARHVEPGEYVVLRLTDEGVGMDAATAARAFEPFFTTKAIGRGTGLGLSTVYGLVRRHGGAIELASEPGRGTTVTILLPCTTDRASEPASAPAAEAPRHEARARGTILVVEDEPLVRAAVTSYLASAGYVVLEAAGAEDAVAHARGHDGPIDLLLTDVVLVGELGDDVARAVAAERPGVSVLFMSAHPLEHLAERGRIARDAMLVQKPFSREALLAVVRARLARSGTLLLVEDDEATRAALRTLLELDGYAVVEAANARQALRASGGGGRSTPSSSTSPSPTATRPTSSHASARSTRARRSSTSPAATPPIRASNGRSRPRTRASCRSPTTSRCCRARSVPRSALRPRRARVAARRAGDGGATPRAA
jgi:DNA-binding response OmpR family regulator